MKIDPVQGSSSRNLLVGCIMVVTLVATMIFSLSADYKHNQHNKLDWRGATIEGFRPGATLLQIESLRGPATVSKEGYWFWKSPDLILTDRGSNLSLTGHQLECQGRIFHCGNRFATDQAFDNLKLGTQKKLTLQNRLRKPTFLMHLAQAPVWARNLITVTGRASY